VPKTTHFAWMMAWPVILIVHEVVGKVAELLAKVGGLGETARDLACRLYTICERKGWAQEALPYNGLVVAWSDVGRMAGEKAREMPMQGQLF